MTESQKILIADDDPDILALVSYRLQRAGYETVQAHNGEEAVEVARRERPDALVLDVMMPKMSGFEVTQALRADAELRDVPIILLTATVQEAHVARGFEAGANDYVRKPFNPQELLSRLTVVLRGKRARWVTGS